MAPASHRYSSKSRKSIENKRLAVFASGAGSTLRAVHEAVLAGQIAGLGLSLVISNNSSSGALEYARESNLPWRHVSEVSCGSSTRHCEALLAGLDEFEIDLLLLAGYMKKVPVEILKVYENRILNVHPALLPAFGGPSMYGDRVHQAVLDRGCKVSGATVHFVSAEYDAGPIISQECCAVMDSDTVESLRQRVQQIERRLLMRSLNLLAGDRLRVAANKVSILEQSKQ